MSNTVRKPLLTTATMTRIAILAAAASILFLLEIPVVAFYKLDLSNIPVLLGAFSMGTVPGLIILALKSMIGLLHSSSAGIGELYRLFFLPAVRFGLSFTAPVDKHDHTVTVLLCLPDPLEQ